MDPKSVNFDSESMEAERESHDPASGVGSVRVGGLLYVCHVLDEDGKRNAAVARAGNLRWCAINPSTVRKRPVSIFARLKSGLLKWDATSKHVRDETVVIDDVVPRASAEALYPGRETWSVPFSRKSPAYGEESIRSLCGVGGVTREMTCHASLNHMESIKAAPTDAKPLSHSVITQVSKQVRLFISYSHRDAEAKDALLLHLADLMRQGEVEVWHDGRIEPGQCWGDEIESKLRSSHIFVPIFSPNFFASDYCVTKELDLALSLEAGGLKLLPIAWEFMDAGIKFLHRIQTIPPPDNPIRKWANQAEAFIKIVSAIRERVDELREGSR